MIELLDIVGQDEALEQIERSMSSGRRPHALMFAGPAGVGRRTTAQALAGLLLCERPAARQNAGRFTSLPPDFQLLQACGQCVDCRMMQKNTHPDFHLIYKELAAYHEDSAVRDRVMQELGIDVVRDFLIKVAGQRPSRGRAKVFVVREAELTSPDAQNSMLKVLEEPPPGVTIILLAEHPQQLLSTTQSRCRIIHFALLPKAFVRQKLVEAAAAKSAQLSPAEAQFWADFTDGSVGRALHLWEAGLYPVKREIVAKVAAMNRAGDADLGEWLHKTSEAIAEDRIKASRVGHTEMAKTLAIRQTCGLLLEIIAALARDAMTLSAGAQRELVHRDQAQAVEALAAKFSLTDLAAIIEQVSQLEQLLWRNVNPKTIWDNVVITCASAAPLRGLD